MHSCIPQIGALATVGIEAVLRDGLEPVVGWLPRASRSNRPDCYDVYICGRLSDGSYRAHAHVDTVHCEDRGFRRDGVTWYAQLAGAGFRRFRRRVPHGVAMRGQSRVIMPTGRIVGAI